MPASPRPQLPPGFVFSQESLQHYCDCPRRFWLAVVCRLPWPSIDAPGASRECRLRRGQEFHRQIERRQRGIGGYGMPSTDPDLATWLDAWARHAPRDLPPMREIESTFGASLRIEDGTSIRLSARFDLIAVEPHRRAVIVDWKTGRAPADPTLLAARMQSLLYPWLLVRASHGLPWGPLLPEQIEMRYWFASSPCNPVVLRYNSEQHARHETRLRTILTDLLRKRTEDEFAPAPDCDDTLTRLCPYCLYRSRCMRSAEPGFSSAEPAEE